MFTRTKIICTIGPSTDSYSSLENLVLSGMDVARINMSHATHKNASNIIEFIHKINKKNKTNVSVLLDTQGPEIRTGDTKLPIDLKSGDIVSLTVRDEVDVETSSIKINYKGLIQSVKKGSKISVDNGLINFEVISKDYETLECKVIDGGKIGSKRHVNLPGVRINLPSITTKDIEDIKFGIKSGVDFIALSFVRSADDITELQKLINKNKSSVKIISKIENQEGLDNIEDICKSSWGVMVARGDLGIETSLTNLPNIQRKIMLSCATYGKRSIVATHLLESMINNPTPTRAEVTDIANAVYEGADAVMLSGETSVGNHPKEVIKTISRIIGRVENSDLISLKHKHPIDYESDRFITKSVCYYAAKIANDTKAKAISTLTNSGYTAYQISSWRPKTHVLVFTSNKRILTQLNLLWGVMAFYYSGTESTDKTIEEINKVAVENNLLQKDDIVINLTSMPIEKRGMVNTIRVSKI